MPACLSTHPPIYLSTYVRTYPPTLSPDVLMSIILLLNLLIAMLGFTFNGVYAEATLEWRREMRQITVADA
eukprot:6185234-Pleurochrysis_carterae.AAC.3